MTRTLCVFVFLMLAAIAGTAHASLVRIIVSGTNQPYVDQFAPALTSLAPESPYGNGFLAAADLAAGSLGVRSYHDGRATQYHSDASAFFYDIDLMNAGSTPVTFGGPLYPLTLSVTATMTDNGEGTYGDLYHRVEAGLYGELNGVSVPSSLITLSYTSTWAVTTVSRSPVSVVTESSVTVQQATYDQLLATLALPEVTLNPGDHFNLHAFLDAATSMVTSYSYGPYGATDAATIPAQLWLQMPGGSTLVDNTGVALSWIEVPEPSPASLALLALLLASSRPCRPARDRVRVPRGSGAAP